MTVEAVNLPNAGVSQGMSEATDPGGGKGCTLNLSTQRKEPQSYPEVGPLLPGPHNRFQSFVSHPVCGNFIHE